MHIQHTPEPWIVVSDRSIYDQLQKIAIADCWEFSSENSETNARRIVACVNACAGKTIEELESCTIGAYKEADDVLLEVERASSDVDYSGRYADGIRALKQQRDGLAALLADAHYPKISCWRGINVYAGTTSSTKCTWCEQKKSAIAKAQGVES